MYLDLNSLIAISASEFQNALPFPWMNPRGILTDSGFKELACNLPPLSAFTPVLDDSRRRKHGQANHTRYVLEYEAGMDLPEPWLKYIDELKSDSYRAFIARLIGTRKFRFRFHWHYTPSGSSVSPHCDSPKKLGSHIFYFNQSHEWDPSWGGETLILDSEGRFRSDSDPEFDDFHKSHSAKTLENHSLIFARRNNSWHGVRPIECPMGIFRKVFIVVFEDYRHMKIWSRRIRRFRNGGPLIEDAERRLY